MADNIFAASSTTGPGSSERIANEFMAQGNPSSPTNVVEGEILGGLDVRTPRVGDGFIEWAVRGYDLEGKHAGAPAGVNYDKHGDWMFDKTAIDTNNNPHSAEQTYDMNYLTNGNKTNTPDRTRKER